MASREICEENGGVVYNVIYRRSQHLLSAEGVIFLQAKDMRDPLLEVFASVNPVQGNTLPCAFSSKNVKIDLYISDSGIDQPADLGSELDEDRLSVVFPSTSEPGRFDEVEQDIVPLKGNILSSASSSKNDKF